MMSNYKWTIRLSLLSIPLLFVVILLTGGGHGFYRPAISFFPLGMLSIVLNDRITIPFIALGLVQFPGYGLIMDKASKNNRSKIALAILIILHVILAISIMILASEDWK